MRWVDEVWVVCLMPDVRASVRKENPRSTRNPDWSGWNDLRWNKRSRCVFLALAGRSCIRYIPSIVQSTVLCVDLPYSLFKRDCLNNALDADLSAIKSVRVKRLLCVS